MTVNQIVVVTLLKLVAPSLMITLSVHLSVAKITNSLFSLELCCILRRDKAHRTGHLILGDTEIISGSPFEHLKVFVFIVAKLLVMVYCPQVLELIIH